MSFVAFLNVELNLVSSIDQCILHVGGGTIKSKENQP